MVVTDWVIAYTAATLQVLLDRAAHRNVLDFFTGKPDYIKEELLKQLNRQLLSVKAVLGDAEEEKIMDPIVKEWVDMLQEAMGDAENLLDDIVTNTPKETSSLTETYVDRLKEYFSYVNPKLEMINKKLTDVVDLKDKLGLKKGKGERESPLSLPTTRFPDEFEPLHGRDSDKRILIEKLKSGNGNRERVTVIAIVGMAGVGKTTLSQSVFHDPEVNQEFKLKSWIHVSERSNVLDLTKKIYISVTLSNTEITDLDLLQKKLSFRLRGRKFLLVLDDFWGEKPQEWDLIKRPLTMGCPGSAIIVTTRVENVAHAMRAALTHHLPLLDDENCSKIFFHHSFRNNDGADANETLTEIGKEIAKKCKGLPLSAGVLGSLLHSTDDAQKWDAVLHSKMWDLPAEKNTIVPALRVSYHYLPSHLKRCFAFCSIFPKGCIVRKWMLIFLWIAHDLIQPKDGKTVEIVGDEYFQELLSRSFLQRSTSNDLSSLLQRSPSNDNNSRSFLPRSRSFQRSFLLGSTSNDSRSLPPRSSSFQHRSSSNDSKSFHSRSFVPRSRSFQQRSSNNDSRPFLPASTSNDLDFVMHDLMNELAQCMGGEIFYKFEGDNLNNIPGKVRHLSFLRDKINVPVQFEAFHDLLQLRTFLPLSSDSQTRGSTSLNDASLGILLRTLRSLRVLSLSNFPISTLPDSIEHLKHLRFLNLSKTKIKELPHFIVSLPNLITLLLSNCDGLIQLPTNFERLTNLRHLDVSGKLFEQMPPNFGKLKSLQMLTTFFASKEEKASRVSELGALTQLSGSLSIVNLQNVLDATEASKAKLREMKFLKELKLRWGGSVELNKEKDVLDKLRSHKFLQKLKIESYGGTEFPQWLGHTSFSNMVSVCLIQCENCSSLPPLGQLYSLKTLCVEGMTSLKKVDSEFYGAHIMPFRSLEILSFEDMGKWEEWVPRKQFPALQELHIRGCPKLRGNLNHQMPSLKKLVILECKSLNLSPVATLKFQKLEHLHLESNSDTLDSFSLSSFPKLCHLHIEGCCSLRSISISLQFQHNRCPLKKIVLKGCPNVKLFPDQQFQLQALEHFHLVGSCDTLNSFPLCSFPALCHLHIEGCCQLQCLSMSPQLQQDLCSFEKLVLKDCPNLDFFPNDGLQTPRLMKLQSLNAIGLQRFTTLKHLVIDGCQMIQDLPGQDFLTTIDFLCIKNCPQLIPYL